MRDRYVESVRGTEGRGDLDGDNLCLLSQIWKESLVICSFSFVTLGKLTFLSFRYIIYKVGIKLIYTHRVTVTAN